MKIYRLVGCVVACLLFGGFVRPLAAQESANLPLVFDKDVNNFGQAHEGDKLQLEFHFRNKSNRTIYIARVRTSCMLCTTAKVNSYTVAPGAKGLVTVTFDTKGMRGQVEKMIYLTTGSVDHEQVYRMGFGGEVLGDVYPEQTVVTKDPFLEGQPNQIEFSIISLLKTPLVFKSINLQMQDADPKQVTVEKVAEKPVKKFGCSGTDYRFRVSFPAVFKPPHSNFAGTVQLATDNKDYPSFTISIYGAVPRHVIVSPAAISADVPRHKKTLVNKTVVLTSPKNLPIAVTSHELLFTPTTTVTVDPATSTGAVKVHLAIQADGENDREHGVLVLKVQVGDKPEIDPYTVSLDIYAGPHPAP